MRFLLSAARATSAAFAPKFSSTKGTRSPSSIICGEGHRRAVDTRADFPKAIWPIGKGHGSLREARPDAVMHFAANALVGESMQNPSKYFRNNIGNGMNLLDAMVETGVQRLRLLFHLRHLRTARARADR